VFFQQAVPPPPPPPPHYILQAPGTFYAFQTPGMNTFLYQVNSNQFHHQAQPGTIESPFGNMNSSTNGMPRNHPFAPPPYIPPKILRASNVCATAKPKAKPPSRKLSQRRKKRYTKANLALQGSDILNLRLQHTKLLCQKIYGFHANPTSSLQKNFRTALAAIPSPHFKQPRNQNLP
jgi:hypothetical protein